MFTNRRNWLFADIVKGAKASASLYGPVQSANQLEPYTYLGHLFGRATCREKRRRLRSLAAMNSDIVPTAPYRSLRCATMIKPPFGSTA
jgi:hypothetical protein